MKNTKYSPDGDNSMLVGCYERITYRTEGGRCTVILNKITEGNGVLIGTECDREGDTRWFNGGTSERKHLVSLEYITKRVPLVLDLNYCELREA